MSDTYIDLDETQFYGTYAAGVIRSHVMGRVPEADALLRVMVTDLESATAAVKGLTESQRQAGAAVRKGSADKKSPLEQGLSVLGRFSTHLDAQPGAVDRRFWFPQDGTAAGVGRGAPRVVLALNRIATELRKPACTIRDKEAWAQEMEVTAASLAPVVDSAGSAWVARAMVSPELEASRQAWLSAYGAAKDVVSGVLRRGGRADLMKVVFHDLAVPALTRISAPIPAPPADPVGSPS